MSRKRLRGKRRAGNITFKNNVNDALAAVEAERRKKRNKRSESLVIKGMAKRNFKPINNDGTTAETITGRWAMIDKALI